MELLALAMAQIELAMKLSLAGKKDQDVKQLLTSAIKNIQEGGKKVTGQDIPGGD
jgi:hypothetical protein